LFLDLADFGDHRTVRGRDLASHILTAPFSELTGEHRVLRYFVRSMSLFANLCRGRNQAALGTLLQSAEMPFAYETLLALLQAPPPYCCPYPSPYRTHSPSLEPPPSLLLPLPVALPYSRFAYETLLALLQEDSLPALVRARLTTLMLQLYSPPPPVLTGHVSSLLPY